MYTFVDFFCFNALLEMCWYADFLTFEHSQGFFHSLCKPKQTVSWCYSFKFTSRVISNISSNTLQEREEVYFCFFKQRI